MTPLPAPWATTLVGLARAYQAENLGPTLPFWSSLLRPLDGEVPLRDVPRLARLSRRAVAPLVGTGEARGLVAVDRSAGARRASVELTAAGQAARAQGQEALACAEAAVTARAGEPVARLRLGLEEVVGRLDLEHPHFPMGYGMADTRVTGGWSVAGHGSDWRPVVRGAEGTAAGLPLSALLSQALVAFAVDVESVPGAEIPLLTASVLRSIPASGVPESHLPPVGAWRPYGGTITVGPPPTGRGKVVQVTAAGRRHCERYLSLCATVEAAWRDRFGAPLVDSLRTAAADTAAALDPDLPAYVVVPWIGGTFAVHGA